MSASQLRFVIISVLAAPLMLIAAIHDAGIAWADAYRSLGGRK